MRCSRILKISARAWRSLLAYSVARVSAWAMARWASSMAPSVRRAPLFQNPAQRLLHQELVAQHQHDKKQGGGNGSHNEAQHRSTEGSVRGTSAANISIPACWMSSIMLIIDFDQAVKSVSFGS